jgi:DNA-binding transcriptional regulator YdaS (Cro superfamily)
MKRGEQARIARQLGVSRAYVTMMLKGKCPIPDRFAPLLTTAFSGLPSKQRVVGSNPSRDAIINLHFSK